MSCGYWMTNITVQGNVVYFYVGITNAGFRVTLKDSTGAAINSMSAGNYGNYALGIPNAQAGATYTLELFCMWENAVCETCSFKIPSLSSIAAVAANPSSDPAHPADQGWIYVSVRLLGGGSFRVLVDGVAVKTYGTYSGDVTVNDYLQVSVGTHNICAEVV